MFGKQGASFLLTTLLLLAPIGAASTLESHLAQKVGLEQRLGQVLPAGTQVRTAGGGTVPIGSLVQGKPILLTFAYYRCPNLCTLVLNGLESAMAQMKLKPGVDYDAITLSIDPKETSSLARAKNKTYLNRLEADRGEPVLASAWAFLSADQTSIETLTRTAGFHYELDPNSREYRHPSGVIVLTPGLKISRYFYGIRFDAQELERSIQAAQQGSVGKLVDAILLFCFHYDPQSSRRSALVFNIIRISSSIAVILIALLLWALSRRKEEANS